LEDTDENPDPERDRHWAGGRAPEAAIIGQQKGATIRGLWKVIAAHPIRRGRAQNAKRSRPHKGKLSGGRPVNVQSDGQCLSVVARLNN
jgi:hypothetical protein